MAENEIAPGGVCTACGAKNSEGSFFCYACGEYFFPRDEKPSGNGAKSDALGIPPATVRASLVIPGRPEIALTGVPTFVERSSFDQTLPQDVLMSISRQHLLITCDGGRYYVQDYGRDGTGSTNHTRLNSIDIHHKGRQPLKDGDRIELAHQVELTLKFQLQQATEGKAAKHEDRV